MSPDLTRVVNMKAAFLPEEGAGAPCVGVRRSGGPGPGDFGGP